MKVPYTNFKTRTGDDTAIGGCGFIGGEWKDMDTAEIFNNKKIVVFNLFKKNLFFSFISMYCSSALVIQFTFIYCFSFYYQCITQKFF